MKLRGLIDQLGGLMDGHTIEEMLDGLKEEDAKYLVKQRQYNPNSKGTYNNYAWVFYAFECLADALRWLSEEAELNWEAGGWETIGLWRIRDGQKAVGEYKYILKTWEGLQPENPDGKWKE
jgi:hypothetical protein